MDTEKLIKEIKIILKGIDKDTLCYDCGWRETSTQVKFGKERLELVILAIRKHLSKDREKVENRACSKCNKSPAPYQEVNFLCENCIPRI